MERNLNAYNVLKQGGIPKPEQYSDMKNGVSTKHHFMEKGMGNSSNKKTTKRRKIQDAYIDRIEKASLRWLLERLSYECALTVNFGN
ncbi:hypothetical protein [Citrobacter braakii]|uniref:hypothetical protein n=1 Tax=Citrobacter braakii TaxID=57706 RepID=UPI0011595B66|nr:hypothetical protein [Citrobacter braakii]